MLVHHRVNKKILYLILKLHNSLRWMDRKRSRNKKCFPLKHKPMHKENTRLLSKVLFGLNFLSYSNVTFYNSQMISDNN